MKRISIIITTLWLCLSLATTTLAANLLVNGDFETGNRDGYAVMPSGWTDQSGALSWGSYESTWMGTASGSHSAIVNPYADETSYCRTLQAYGPGRYVLSGWYRSPYQDRCTGIFFFELGDATATLAATSITWTQFIITLTPASSGYLRIGATADGNDRLGIDNLALEALAGTTAIRGQSVGEPGVLGLAGIAGFVYSIGMTRRRGHIKGACR